MAEAMSLSLMAFLVLPVIAPLIGQGILLIAGWQAIFVTMAALAHWCCCGHGGSCPKRSHRSIGVLLAWGRYGLVCASSHATATRSDMAWRPCSCSLLSMVSSPRPSLSMARLWPWQPVSVRHGRDGCCAVRLGLRLFASHQALRCPCNRPVCLIGLCRLCQAYGGDVQPWHAAILAVLRVVTAMMAMFTWADATLGALSMNNLGQVAGTAASAFGAIQALGATFLGSLIGQGYDGTPRSLVWGVLMLGLASLLSIAWARRARLSR